MCKIIIDSEADCAYIKVSDNEVSYTVEYGNLLVDFDNGLSIVGIEIIGWSKIEWIQKK